MSCCSETRDTKHAFLTQKLSNFRALVQPLCTTDRQKAALETFQTVESVMPYLLQLLALKRLGPGGVEPLVNTFLAEFPGAPDEFKTKVGLYVDMFCDVLS